MIPHVDSVSFRRIASGLVRPEGVCVDPLGDVWAADGASLVARLTTDGRLERIGGGARPNGILADVQGRIVVADMGAGSLVRVDPLTATVETLATDADASAIPAPNFPAIDRDGRIWCSNSTMLEPRDALRERPADGFIFVVNTDGTSHMVADGLQFPNGLAFSTGFEFLYVAESTGRRIVRASVRGETLGRFEQVGHALPATPDGIAFDSLGNLWVTLVLETNALAVITPEGDLHIVVEDVAGDVLRMPTNIAFGGNDGRDLLVSSVVLDHLLMARVEVSGLPLPGSPRYSVEALPGRNTPL